MQHVFSGTQGFSFTMDYIFVLLHWFLFLPELDAFGSRNKRQGLSVLETPGLPCQLCSSPGPPQRAPHQALVVMLSNELSSQQPAELLHPTGLRAHRFLFDTPCVAEADSLGTVYTKFTNPLAFIPFLLKMLYI